MVQTTAASAEPDVRFVQIIGKPRVENKKKPTEKDAPNSLIFVARTFKSRECCNNSILFFPERQRKNAHENIKIKKKYKTRKSQKTHRHQPIRFTLTTDTCHYTSWMTHMNAFRTWLNDSLMARWLNPDCARIWPCVAVPTLSSQMVSHLLFFFAEIVHKHTRTGMRCWEGEPRKRKAKKTRSESHKSRQVAIWRLLPRQHDKQSLM